MITKRQYDKLQKQHEKACKENDYSKMIMMGDANYKLMKEYEQEKVCKHSNCIDIQGGQIVRCLGCGKEWG